MNKRAFPPIVVLARRHGDRQSARRAEVAEDEVKRVTEATTVLEEIMAAADKAVPRVDHGEGRRHRGVPVDAQGRHRASARQHGRGILSVRDKKTGGWSSPAFLTHHRRQLRRADRRAGDRPGAGDQRPARPRAAGEEPVQGRRGCRRRRGPGRPRRQRLDRHPDARADPQLLTIARIVRGCDAERIDDPPGPRRQRALLRHGYRTGQIVFDGMGGSPDAANGWKATLAKYAK